MNVHHSMIHTSEKTIITTAKIVIIAAYMRTGSTFMGGIFQRYPGTFYLFEPLHYIDDSLEKRNSTQLMSVSGKTR